MKYIKMILQIVIIYVIYYVGILIQGFLNLPIPGSLIGMLLLFLLLQFKIINEKWLEQGSQVLLTYLSLLFVPATVGVINYFSLFKGKGLLTIGIALLSTFLVITISSAVGQLIARKKEVQKSKNFDGSVDV